MRAPFRRFALDWSFSAWGSKIVGMNNHDRLRKAMARMSEMPASLFTVGDILDLQRIATALESYPGPWDDECSRYADSLETMIQRANAGISQPANESREEPQNTETRIKRIPSVSPD